MSHRVPEGWQPFTPELIHRFNNANGEWTQIVSPCRYFDASIRIKGKSYNVREIHANRIKVGDKYIIDSVHSWEHIKYLGYVPGEGCRRIKTLFTNEDILNSQIQLLKVKLYNKFVDELEVGDFVQFTTQRDKTSWRKIIRLDFDSFNIFGHKYDRPVDNDKYDCRHSSNNGIQHIRALVKAKDAIE